MAEQTAEHTNGRVASSQVAGGRPTTKEKLVTRGTVWFTGLSGAGKTTVATTLKGLLDSDEVRTFMLDGDLLREGLNADLTFSEEDRVENVRRVGEVALLFASVGHLCLVTVISPYDAGRASVRARHDTLGIPFVEVYVATPLEVCESRDPKASTPAPGGERSRGSRASRRPTRRPTTRTSSCSRRARHPTSRLAKCWPSCSRRASPACNAGAGSAGGNGVRGFCPPRDENAYTVAEDPKTVYAVSALAGTKTRTPSRRTRRNPPPATHLRRLDRLRSQAARWVRAPARPEPSLGVPHP